MEEQCAVLALTPGHALGGLNLGASLNSTLSFIRSRRKTFLSIDVQYSQISPLSTSIIVSLPKNGLRLRFDGPEQRLRCIELLDFAKANVSFKNGLVGKAQEGTAASSAPSFRRVYQMFGATFPGDYMPPQHGQYSGTYVLSWPGIAFSFPMQHSAWSPSKDHVSLLGSQAAGSASHMIVFHGKSWPEACKTLFLADLDFPRNPIGRLRGNEPMPVDIELLSLSPTGDILLHRKAPAGHTFLVVNRTTPQDLITELGPPDARYKRDQSMAATRGVSHHRSDSTSKPSNNRRPQAGSTPSSYSSTATDTYETDFDSDVKDDDPLERASRETFWCYFKHGLDILVAPTQQATVSSFSNTAHPTSTKLVVKKVIVHGNVPGTYAFNRHRRLRWQLALDTVTLNSESSFEDVLKPALLEHFSKTSPITDMIRGKVINRSWSTGSDDGTFFLPDAGAELIEGEGSEQWLGNSRLYHFPNLVFEVADNGCVAALTRY